MLVSDIETRIARPGHTLHLVCALQNDYPKKRFRLLFGADIYYQRHEWYKFDEIVKLAPPIYVAREGVDPIPEPTLSAPPGMSSTELRAALRSGERPRDALPEPILDYIDKNNLYRSAL
jgi:nicotinate-nucleotide adenylyltransferase